MPSDLIFGPELFESGFESEAEYYNQMSEVSIWIPRAVTCFLEEEPQKLFDLTEHEQTALELICPMGLHYNSDNESLFRKIQRTCETWLSLTSLQPSPSDWEKYQPITTFFLWLDVRQDEILKALYDELYEYDRDIWMYFSIARVHEFIKQKIPLSGDI